MDLAIGEFALIGQGIGPQIIRDFLGACVWPHPDITAVMPAFWTETIRLQGEDFERHVRYPKFVLLPSAASEFRLDWQCEFGFFLNQKGTSPHCGWAIRP
jgi:hypothetical protein